jgi:hypothetical protein
MNRVASSSGLDSSGGNGLFSPTRLWYRYHQLHCQAEVVLYERYRGHVGLESLTHSIALPSAFEKRHRRYYTDDKHAHNAVDLE